MKKEKEIVNLVETFYKERIKNTIGNCVVVNMNEQDAADRAMVGHLGRSGVIGKYSYWDRRADHIWNFYIEKANKGNSNERSD